MNQLEILETASNKIDSIRGQVLEVLSIARPPDVEYAKNLAKILSKVSPLIGNMIELTIVNMLNELDWQGLGKWKRQDPDFPDTIFEGSIDPNPGIEIKTWFPLATEITARFKDSILRFTHDHINVAVVAWLPEQILFGRPKIIDVWIGSGRSLAAARDSHYHNPPDYLVFEPRDTSARTRNLQQTCTNGYKFQGSQEQLESAREEVASWGAQSQEYDPSIEYQLKLESLLGEYPYRLDTNFAKIDRIEHAGLEDFKLRTLDRVIDGQRIKDWVGILSSDDEQIRRLIAAEH